MDGNLNVELSISNVIKYIETKEELRKILIKILQKQALLKFDLSNFNGIPVRAWIGPVSFNGRIIKFKLSSIDSNKDGVWLENLEEYLLRNKWESQINTYFNYIIECTKNKDNSSIKLSENRFENRQVKMIEGEIETIFTHNEILEICKKLNSPHVRFLSRKFSENICELHQITMQYYNIYGGYILTFILSLPPIKFSDNKCFEIKDYKTKPQLIPTLSIKTQNSNYNEFTICFYPPIKLSGEINKTASIYNQSKEIIGEILNNGTLISRDKKFTTKLSFFAKNSFKNLELFTGTEYGKCNFCQSLLEDPISIKWGYGKTCAEKLGLPYS